MGNSASSPAVYSSLSRLLGVTQPSTAVDEIEWSIDGLGRVRGRTFEVEEGRKVHAFLGVPFAKCGSGEERFKVRSLGLKREGKIKFFSKLRILKEVPTSFKNYKPLKQLFFSKNRKLQNFATFSQYAQGLKAILFVCFFDSHPRLFIYTDGPINRKRFY